MKSLSLRLENLESRCLLAASVLHNPVDHLDVDQDGQRTLEDGLAVVRFLTEHGSMQLAGGVPGAALVDVNGDDVAAPRDVLDWMAGMAEGEPLGATLDPLASQSGLAAAAAADAVADDLHDLIDEAVAGVNAFVDQLVASQREFQDQILALAAGVGQGEADAGDIQDAVHVYVDTVHATIDGFLAQQDAWLDELLGRF